MKITVIGWYGTETIGDRAILAGLISFFSKAYGDFSLQLGSLYPFFSQRTVAEDRNFIENIIGTPLKVSIFDSHEKSELESAIQTSDLLVMGGGPLMDLVELYMIEYAFKYAKKEGVSTAILGCGVGPLFKKKYRKSVYNISKNADRIILRDSQSKELLEKIYKEQRAVLDTPINVSFDPAVECVHQYKKIHQQKNTTQNRIAINVREFPREYSEKELIDVNEKVMSFIKEIARKNSDTEIILVPMHYFHVGGDDRVVLNKIRLEINESNVIVQNKNLSLEETISMYESSKINIGMRFHAVVLQTMSNGNNYVLDYTQPKIGKISGFIKDMDPHGFYNERYVSLQELNTELTLNIEDGAIFKYQTERIEAQLSIYTEILKELFYTV